MSGARESLVVLWPVLAFIAGALLSRALGLRTVGPWYASVPDMIGLGLLAGASIARRIAHQMDRSWLLAQVEHVLSRVKEAQRRVEGRDGPPPFVTEIRLCDAAAEKVAELLEHPPPPTPALIELLKGKP